MGKLLVICGPTATGKTKLAFNLAKKFNGELISADSRMVYKHMDIGTGKDLNKYEKILGYDLVGPDEEFSVSNYLSFANQAIRKIYEQKKLPILVGGTGFYIKAVVDNPERINIPRNLNLRKKLSQKTARELFAILVKTNPVEALKLNSSDNKNPRRLIRLLEVLDYGKTAHDGQKKINFDNVLWIGITCPLDILKERIEKRVDERVNASFEKEIEFLKRKGFWDKIPSKTLGYKNWPNIEKWKLEEFKYAKRQITWFKKEKRITWFDITKKGFEKDVENLVQKWCI